MSQRNGSQEASEGFTVQSNCSLSACNKEVFSCILVQFLQVVFIVDMYKETY